MTFNEVINGTKEYGRAGRFFELLATVNPVNVRAYAKDGRTLADEKQVSAGYWIDRVDREHFARIEIETGAAEAVKFVITDGLSGNRTVPASITATVQPLGLAHASALKTAAAAAVNALAANANRRYLQVQNQSATENVYVRCDGTAAAVTAASTKLLPGQTWEPLVPPLGAVSIIRGGAVDADCNVIEA